LLVSLLRKYALAAVFLCYESQGVAIALCVLPVVAHLSLEQE